jgi:ABC-type multidrug transport system ATPase subunit
MDEPTAGLDPKERVHLRNILAKIAQDCIVIVATHVVSDIENVADEILILKEGVLFDKNTPEDLIGKYAPGKNLESVYLHIFGSEESL